MSTKRFRILLPAAAALALALPARAQFEGVIESKMTMSGEKGQAGATGTTYVSKSGARMEMNMETPMGSMKMTTLHRNDKPGVVYMLNDARKTYSEVDVSKTPQTASTEKYTVKKLADEKVSGYDCQHALLTNDKGEESEVWVTKEIGGSDAFWAGQERRRGGKSGLGKALKDAGLDGWPMRMKTHPRGNEGSMTWEVVKVEKKSVPSSMLEVPAGYTKSEGGPMGMAGGMQLSPEQQKKMDDAMKARDEALSKMTPEQRKQYEEMMKSMGGEKK
jgi:hypothetical protein